MPCERREQVDRPAEAEQDAGDALPGSASGLKISERLGMASGKRTDP